MAPHITMRARIVTELENGWSLAAMADHFNIARNIVFLINKRWKEERTIERGER